RTRRCTKKALAHAWSPCPARHYLIVSPWPYREAVLPSSCRQRIAIEAASADYWRKYVGLDGAVIGMRSFGLSAPDKALYAHFGITLDASLQAARAMLSTKRSESYVI
ncbi:hypothetical protein HC761_01015, partial [bacterium]|nr:hypothetical protein [bacterium]